MKLSHSKISCFEECQYKFKLHYIDDIRIDKTTEELITGTNVHKIFDEVYEHCKTIEELENWLRNHKKYLEYKSHIENFIQLNKHFLKYNKSFIPLHTELVIENQEWNFVGIIDRVDKTATDVIVLDYKTGKEHPIKDYYQQLAIYKKIFEEKYEIKITQWGIFFSKTGNFIIEPVKNQEVIKADLRIHANRNRILEKLNNKNSVWYKGFKYCKWCEYNPEYCQGNHD